MATRKAISRRGTSVRLFVCVAASVGALSLRGAVVLGPIFNPINSNYYTLITSNTWTGADTEALTMNGRLATVHSAPENDWLFDTFSGGQRNLWLGLTNSSVNLAFGWVDGSAFSYSNWDTANGQPDLGGEHWSFIVQGDLGHGLTAGKWHDVTDDADASFPWLGPIYGVVEFAIPPRCSPHRATATATVANGVIVGATVLDVGCGYTNEPLVLIQGGGGTGATATAVMNNGVIVGIYIASSGCCYSTNPPPRIAIASPPFVPTVSIAASRVNVTQHVVLGRDYVLESSNDLVHWTAIGPAFTALSEDIVTEFVVGETGRFFRVRQVQ